jgi:hypothetical protein
VFGYVVHMLFGIEAFPADARMEVRHSNFTPTHATPFDFHSSFDFHST